jgi:hypothetical protein
MRAPLPDRHRLVILTDQGAITMKQVQERTLTASPSPRATEPDTSRTPAPLALWQLNLLRVGYLVMTVGLAVIKWPLLVSHDPWSVPEGTKECLLIAMSFLALLGLRYPVRMLPILLFEVTWKLLWFGIVFLPQWANHELDGATRTQAGAIAWGVIIVAVIPWRQVLARFVVAPADPWRRQK